MKHEITCTACPMGCRITVELEEPEGVRGSALSVPGPDPARRMPVMPRSQATAAAVVPIMPGRKSPLPSAL